MAEYEATADNESGERGAMPKNDMPQTELRLSREEKQEIVRTARDRWDRAMACERENINLAYDDLEFLAGNQTPADIIKMREAEGRPNLTFNQMPQFVHQVTGDIRKRRPAIKVVGTDDRADPKLADLREGMTRYIENRSDASGIYFQAADSQVACGIGHARIITEYADDTTFEQEIRIEGVDDGVAVLWDPDAKRLTREDANWCFVPVDMTATAFKEKYPDASEDTFEEPAKWEAYSDWVTGDTVRVAEYWVKKPKTLILGLTKDGQTINLTEDDEEYTAAEKVAICKANGVRIEKRESYTICRYLISASDVLESSEWAGRFIPIVPFVGEEVRIGRKLVRRGIIRECKDAQRQYNYFNTAHTEIVALQPKAPYLLTETNVAKYQGMWEQANVKNFPYLLYTPDSKNGNLLPSRIAPAVSSQGITDGLMLANENMRRITGIYDASLGAKSNETSGVAIKQREQQGDTGTVLYHDNFSRAVRQIGKIVIDLIPHVYDTQRTIRIMGEDGKIDLMQINQERDQAGMPIVDPRTGQPVVLNDMSVGSYDVIAEAGNSYATKREEASDNMVQFMQALPNVAPLVADLIARAQDWPMADKFADRLHAALPPQIIEAEKQKEAQEKGQPPQQDPAMMQQQQMAQQMAAVQAQELQAKAAAEAEKARKAKADADKAEADAVLAQIEVEKAKHTAPHEAKKAELETMLTQQKLGQGEVEHAKGIDKHNMEMEAHRHTMKAGEVQLKQGEESHKAKLAQPKGEKGPKVAVNDEKAIGKSMTEAIKPMSEAVNALAGSQDANAKAMMALVETLSKP